MERPKINEKEAGVGPNLKKKTAIGTNRPQRSGGLKRLCVALDIILEDLVIDGKLERDKN